MDKLPLYKVKVNEDLSSNEGIDFVSLVDYPAIESNWVAFNKVTQQYFFDDEKQMLYGAILIPDKPIYRNSPEMGEYNVTFPEKEVIALVRKFQAQKKSVNLNYQHQENSQLTNAVIQEIWLTGKVDKSQSFGFNFPVNTAMVGVHIGDKKFWDEEVKTGNVKGFSIEGWLDMELRSIKLNKQKYKMEVKTKDGAYTITTPDDVLVVGSAVTITATDGSTTLDGSFDLENNTTIDVVAGKVTEVADTASDVAEEGLSNEEVKIIEQAMSKKLAAMQLEFNNKIAALEVKFANQPAGSTHKKDEAKPIELNSIEKVKQLLTKNKK